MQKVLIVDNYDSFTFNLAHYVESYNGFQADVVRSRELSLDDVAVYDKIIFSPGPGLPSDYPIMFEILEKFGNQKNILGVCLGHQAIGEFYGAKLFNLTKVFHGVKRELKIIQHDDIFNNIPAKFSVGRYHSWAISKQNFPEDLTITAVDNDDIIMSINHKKHKIKGLQYHPESILSEYGKEIIYNWLKL
jgi:anthranilate synthase component II